MGREVFSFDVDEKGTFCIEKVADSRKWPVRSIVTRTLDATSSSMGTAESNEANSADEPVDSEETCVVNWRSGSAVMLLSDCKRKGKSARLWADHLPSLCRFAKDARAAFALAAPPRYGQTDHEYTPAEKELFRLLAEMQATAEALERAAPVTLLDLARDELKELKAERDAAETGADAQEIEALVRRRTEVNKWFAYQRRKAWKKSPHSKPYTGARKRHAEDVSRLSERENLVH